MSNLWVLPTELGDQSESEYAYEAAKTASFLLWAMSGRRFNGVSSVTERYTQPPVFTDAQAILASLEGNYLAPLTELIPRPAQAQRIRLKQRPVDRISAIRLPDGSVVSPDSYYLVNHSTLQFRNGVPDDFEVTYSYGMPPPVAGRMAARMLAIEFAKLWSGDDECELPSRVTSVSRQGLTFTIIDNQDFIADLRTGVYAVDLFLKSVNPNKAKAKAKVFSVDTPRGRRYTPKALKLPVSDYDISVSAHTGTGTASVAVADVDAEFLELEPDWTLELIIRNWGESKSLTLSSSSATVDSGVISLTVPYEDSVSVVGLTDPGSWDLYAVKDGTTTYITSGNLRTKLDSN